ncbi:unnamed protein product [Diamesa hyperborea]
MEKKHKVLYLIVILQVVVGAKASICEYYMNSRYGYSCEYTHRATSSIEEVTQIEGIHMDGKTDADVEFIQAFDSVLVKIPEIIFKKFNKLNRFDFQNVQLTTLEEFTFQWGTKLKHINLNSNRIRNIPDRAFHNCENLEQIFIQSNNITSIDLNAFGGLTSKLTILNLNNNKITEIQYEHFRPLTNLKELYLFNNNINVIHPGTFKSLSKLVFLYIHSNQISYVHSDVLKPLVNLKTLYARDNSQTSTTPSSTPSSTSSSTSSSTPSSTPSSTTSSTTSSTPSNKTPVEATSICSTKQDSGYTCVFTNVTLKEQNYLKITVVHENGKTDNDVITVIFINSLLVKVPREIFERFENLDRLKIQGTKLAIMNENTFELCGKLNYLDASDNQIRVISSSALEKCTELETLNLHNNFITKIEPCNNFLTKLTKLKNLSLTLNMCIDENFINEKIHEKLDELVLDKLNRCFSMWYL